MLRNASTVYAFDFFQTLIQQDSTSIFNKIFGSRLLCNPHRLGIRWIIIASLPKIYYPFIKFLCLLRGLNPVEVILSNEWFHVKDTKNFVLNTIMNISNGKFKLNYVNSNSIRRIRFISNNIELVKYMNENISTLTNNILCQSVSDFWEQKFESVI